MDLLRLRDATAEEHERVERLVPLMREDLDRAAYVAALKRFYGFVKGWETWAFANAPEDILAELAERRRSLFLERDLAHFDEPLSDNLFRPKLGPADRNAVLGSMYVMEGSTLGGQFIAAHVEKTLHLQRGEGNAYFAGYGDQTGSMWRRFKGMLAAVPQEQGEHVIAAATQTFRDFGAWMQPLNDAWGHNEVAGQAAHG